MICIPIVGPLPEDVYHQLDLASTLTTLVELRLDLFEDLSEDFLKKLQSNYPIEMIFKHPSPTPKQIELLTSFNPKYLDFGTEDSTLHSYHNYESTPHNFDEILVDLRKKGAPPYKIAVTPHTILDVMRLMLWLKKNQCIGISMGYLGAISRILSPIFNQPFTYASLQKGLESAKGQIPASTLCSRYPFKKLSPSSKIYGLIGSPVHQSVSDITHNAVFAKHNHDAVYIKMDVKPDELQQFLIFAKELPIQGLSVTMPLKEKIIPFLDWIDPIAKAIGAVNTLILEHGIWKGYNTDGSGALKAIEKHLSIAGKKILLLGSGGAAKAIAYTLAKEDLTISNRTAQKAIDLATSFGLKTAPFNGNHKNYDLIINATSHPFPIDLPFTSAYLMDIHIQTTPFLAQSNKQICGLEMFIEQALEQFHLWLGPIDTKKYTKTMKEALI